MALCAGAVDQDQNEIQRLRLIASVFGMPPLQRVLDHAGHERLISEPQAATALIRVPCAMHSLMLSECLEYTALPVHLLRGAVLHSDRSCHVDADLLTCSTLFSECLFHALLGSRV